MAWRRLGDKPLSEPMMVSLLTHICVTRPQWVQRYYITTDNNDTDTNDNNIDINNFMLWLWLSSSLSFLSLSFHYYNDCYHCCFLSCYHYYHDDYLHYNYSINNVTIIMMTITMIIIIIMLNVQYIILIHNGDVYRTILVISCVFTQYNVMITCDPTMLYHEHLYTTGW